MRRRAIIEAGRAARRTSIVAKVAGASKPNAVALKPAVEEAAVPKLRFIEKVSIGCGILGAGVFGVDAVSGGADWAERLANEENVPDIIAIPAVIGIASVSGLVGACVGGVLGATAPVTVPVMTAGVLIKSASSAAYRKYENYQERREAQKEDEGISR